MPETGLSKKSAVVLLSSGLDSTFNLFKAREQFEVRVAVTFNYGQKAAQREINAASHLCALLKISHQVIALPWFPIFTSTALVGNSAIPQGADVAIENANRSRETAKLVWVPNRNGIFLNIAAGLAEGLNATFVVPGFNAEEAETFPDNSLAFLESLDKAWIYSTQGRVRTFCFSIALNKTEIVREALSLKIPLEKLWPCYLDGEEWCAQCESCLRFRRALEANALDFDQLQQRSQ